MNFLKKLFSPVRVEDLMKQEIKRTESQINEVALVLFKHRQCVHHYENQLEFLTFKVEKLKKQINPRNPDHDDDNSDQYIKEQTSFTNSVRNRG